MLWWKGVPRSMIRKIAKITSWGIHYLFCKEHEFEKQLITIIITMVVIILIIIVVVLSLVIIIIITIIYIMIKDNIKSNKF